MRVISSVLAFTMLFGLLGCSGSQGPAGMTGPPGPPGPPGSSTTGSMVGKVIVYSCGGAQLPSQGVTVSIEGTRFTTLSDSSGAWRIDSLPAGVYVISFSRPGLGTFKILNFQFAGNGVFYLGTTGLAELPTGFTSEMSVIEGLTNGEPYLRVSYRVSGVCGSLPCPPPGLVVLGPSLQSLGPMSYTIAEAYSFNCAAPSDGLATHTFTRTQLRSAGLSSGSKLYLKSYCHSGASYFDPRVEQFMFSGVSVSPAAVDSILVP